MSKYTSGSKILGLKLLGQLTPWSKILLEIAVVAQLFKFLAFDSARRFITVLVAALN
jgi:hypothetical protein